MVVPIGFHSSVDIDDNAQEIFEKVFTKGWVGASYTPLAYATQNVEGKMYLFFCNAVASGKQRAPEFDSYVFVYVPEGGEPELCEISSIN